MTLMPNDLFSFEMSCCGDFMAELQEILGKLTVIEFYFSVISIFQFLFTLKIFTINAKWK